MPGLAQQDMIGLTVDVSKQRVRVEVADDALASTCTPYPSPHPNGSGVGGLRFVRQLADRWGVVRNEPNQVWIEVSL